MVTDMISTALYPSRKDANDILAWAYEQNPGPWTQHCKVVARAAETIARKSGLDADRAYVSGLLHDIGYYSYKDGIGETCHIYSGYELMLKKGYAASAKICLTHSFPNPDIREYGGGDMNCLEEETAVISNFLSNTTYDDYDRLIQLCDCIGSAQGVCLMEKRIIDVMMRHGYKVFSELTVNKWASYFAIKNAFDKMCGANIYNLFYEELIADIFGG